MYKTTLYLPEQDIARLKSLSPAEPKRGLTYHIQQAVKLYLKNFQGRKKDHFQKWRQVRGSSSNVHFSDALAYQKKMRNDWDH